MQAKAPGSRVKHSWRSVAGFTLIELPVVIAVIAILAALLLPALTRGYGGRRFPDLRS